MKQGLLHPYFTEEETGSEGIVQVHVTEVGLKSWWSSEPVSLNFHLIASSRCQPGDPPSVPIPHSAHHTERQRVTTATQITLQE